MFDPITLSFFGLFAVFAILETLRPRRTFPAVRLWRLRGVAFFVGVLFLSAYPALMWDHWLAEVRVFDATGLGHVWGACLGFVVFQFAIYGWHRAMHGVDFFFRWSHRLHHSARRLDVFGAFYFSPFDVVGQVLAGSVALVAIVGITGPAAVAVTVAGVFCALFQHSNIRTPRWLGYIIQRPESHALHHQRGRHAGNYADLPLIDMMFGTFENPVLDTEPCGF